LLDRQQLQCNKASETEQRPSTVLRHTDETFIAISYGLEPAVRLYPVL